MSDDDAASVISSVSSIANQPVIPHSPPLVPFALNPSHAMQGVINFAKLDNIKVHKKGNSQLSEDRFDCVPEDLHQFPKTLSNRAMEYQWNDEVLGIFMIPEHPILPTKYTNLLTNHGELEIDDDIRFEKS